MVSAEKLKKDFKEFETENYYKLSADELDRLIESLVFKMFKGFKKGRIFENPDIKETADELDKCYDAVKYKFNNVSAVIFHKKFTYLFKACITADEVVRNQNLKQLNLVYHDILDHLESNIKILNILLMLYYDNYSNSAILNELMFNLSTVDDLPLTFDIHDKYTYGDEFGLNYPLMKDLDRFIAATVKIILYSIENADKFFYDDTDETDIDNAVESVKAELKYIFGDANDFETAIISETGYDDAIIERIGIIKESIANNERYFKLKNEFLNLYDDGNAFKEIAADDFEIHKEFYPDADFDDFMKHKPKYDLKECKLIKPEISGIKRN